MLSNIKDMIKNKNLRNKLLTKNFLIFAVIGIIISYIFFTMLSFLLRTPFIIIFGLILGYGMNSLYLSSKKS